MTEKPTYEELEERVAALEAELIRRNNAEARLRESERHLGLLLDSTAEGIFGLDLEGRFTCANLSCARMLGYGAPDKLVGRKAHPLIHHTRQDGRPYQEDACRMCEAFRAGKRIHADDEWLWRSDGTGFMAEYWSYPIERDDRVYGAVVTFLDMTERRATEMALIMERDRVRQYIDLAGVIFIALDRKGRVSLINKKGAQILECREEEIVGKNWFDSFLPQDQREDVKAVFRALVAGDIDPVEYYENPVVTASGKQRIIAWHNAVLRDETGQVIGTLGSGEDITDRKQADALLREREVESESRARRLAEANAALEFLLKKREDDKAVVKENIVFHVKELVQPYIEKLKTSPVNRDQSILLAILESNLDNLVSPFANRLSSRYLDLTPMEIRVADLVKQGKANKEIAQVLNISVNTVRFHRSNLRDKLGLKTKKKNLRSTLFSLQE